MNRTDHCPACQGGGLVPALGAPVTGTRTPAYPRSAPCAWAAACPLRPVSIGLQVSAACWGGSCQVWWWWRWVTPCVPDRMRLPPANPGLRPAPPGRRQNPARDAPLHQAIPRPPPLPRFPEPARSGTRNDLTNIGASDRGGGRGASRSLTDSPLTSLTCGGPGQESIIHDLLSSRSRVRVALGARGAYGRKL
jgi:hypothetical protein